MKRTAEGIEITVADDPVILASAFHAGVDFSKFERDYWNSEEEPARSDMAFWACELENRFSIWDGQLHLDNLNESNEPCVVVQLSPADIIGALAAFGAVMIPAEQIKDGSYATDPTILDESQRLNALFEEALALEAG